MSIAEKLETIAANQERVYDAGFAAGQEAGGGGGYDEGVEAGKQAAYDELWDNLQANGNRTNYERAFGTIWYDHSFKPKHSFRPKNANTMFSYSNITDLQAILDEQGVTLDLSDVRNNQMVQWLQNSTITRVGVVDMSRLTNATYVFYGASSLVTIEKLIFAETNVFANNWFQNCKALKNINEVEGVISNSISFNWSEVTPATMKRIIACLKNYAGTDKANTYQIKFNDACWAALEADSAAPDGGTWKDYVYFTLGWNT